MPNELDRVLGEIDAAVVRPPRDLGTLEHTLTDGYAHALTLELERSRLQRRLTEVAHTFADGDATLQAQELVSLAARLQGNSGDLQRLRGALARLRRHADGLRAAGCA